MGELRIGDQVRYRGRVFHVCGFSPMSLPEQTVELADLETGVLIEVTLAHLGAVDEEDAAATAARASKRLQNLITVAAWRRRGGRPDA